MEDARVGQVLDGRYRIVERLAAGGMGVVYRGERLGLGKSVAVKFLHRTTAMIDANRVRFEREAAAMSRLTHPNLVSIIDYGSSDGLPYLVMEYHPGATLAEALQGGPIEPPRAVFIARQMLAGLASAHVAGVVHRDLKPGNVLLVGAPGEDLVKILDFGVAKLLDSGMGPTEVSVVSGHTLGTPAYMSPEHAKGEAVDGRADVYATGVMLYEMVTGRRPFSAEGKLGLLRKQVEEAPQSPRARTPKLSEALEHVILRAMAKAREDRWGSAVEFAIALGDVPEGRTGRQLSDSISAPIAGGTPMGDLAALRRPTPVPSPAPRPAVPAGARPRARTTDKVAPRPPPTRAPGRRRRTNVGRGIFIGVLVSVAAAAALYLALDRGLIDLEVSWLSWAPWNEWAIY